MIAGNPRILMSRILAVLCTSVVVIAGTPQATRDFESAWGPRFAPVAQPTSNAVREIAAASGSATNMMVHWNHVSIDASGLDHKQPGPGDTHVFGQQLGPCRAARAIAIVQLAVFEAANAITPRFRSYVGFKKSGAGASMDAAIAQAAHDSLVAMFPSQAAAHDAVLASDLALIPATGKSGGIAIGKAAAAAVLANRASDGSEIPEPLVNSEFIPSMAAGKWRQDPISLIPLALGAHWDQVVPFAMVSASQFRAPVPPALTSAAYAAAYNEVKSLGGDGVITPTTRTEEQTEIGIYWAYDGTPSLCAPPRLYNQIALQIAAQKGTTGVDLARLLALINMAMADAGIAIWESKYFYQYWRPVTGIREADPGTGPSGTGDNNPGTTGDALFSPLGAPASNLMGPNFTPPFPAYPSGHAGFGGALFQMLRDFYKTDNIPFTFVSDEFNGVTIDNAGMVRPLIPRSFSTLSQAEEENGQSRIYLGIHWQFDKTAGLAQGRQVARFVFKTQLKPLN
jgi:hypothetical protein